VKCPVCTGGESRRIGVGAKQSTSFTCRVVHDALTGGSVLATVRQTGEHTAHNCFIDHLSLKRADCMKFDRSLCAQYRIDKCKHTHKCFHVLNIHGVSSKHRSCKAMYVAINRRRVYLCSARCHGDRTTRMPSLAFVTSIKSHCSDWITHAHYPHRTASFCRIIHRNFAGIFATR